MERSRYAFPKLGFRDFAGDAFAVFQARELSSGREWFVNQNRGLRSMCAKFLDHFLGAIARERKQYQEGIGTSTV